MDGLFQILSSDDGTIIITNCMIHVNPIIVTYYCSLKNNIQPTYWNNEFKVKV